MHPGALSSSGAFREKNVKKNLSYGEPHEAALPWKELAMVLFNQSIGDPEKIREPLSLPVGALLNPLLQAKIAWHLDWAERRQCIEGADCLDVLEGLIHSAFRCYAGKFEDRLDRILYFFRLSEGFSSLRGESALLGQGDCAVSGHYDGVALDPECKFQEPLQFREKLAWIAFKELAWNFFRDKETNFIQDRISNWLPYLRESRELEQYVFALFRVNHRGLFSNILGGDHERHCKAARQFLFHLICLHWNADAYGFEFKKFFPGRTRNLLKIWIALEKTDALLPGNSALHLSDQEFQELCSLVLEFSQTDSLEKAYLSGSKAAGTCILLMSKKNALRKAMTKIRKTAKKAT